MTPAREHATSTWPRCLTRPLTVRSRLCHGENRWEPVTRGKRPQEMSVLPVCEFDGPGILSATPQHSTTSPPFTSMPNRVRMYEAWCIRVCNIVRFVRKMKLDPEPVPSLPFQRWCLITFSLGSYPWVAEALLHHILPTPAANSADRNRHFP